MSKVLRLAAALIAFAAGHAAADEKAALVSEGQGLIKEFGSALKAELVSAIEAGGAANAIAVCNVRAPEIAAAISEDSGWTVARSSHRLRNPQNAPDRYTAGVIEDFLAHEENGETATDLTRAEIVTEDGRRVFRMTKAIPTGEVCLTCHGDLDPGSDLARAIDELYPNDAARGFALGDMRGVFVLRKPLD